VPPITALTSLCADLWELDRKPVRALNGKLALPGKWTTPAGRGRM